MEAVKVEVSEFRENLATYIFESEAPVAITGHGDTLGYFLPVHRSRTDAEKNEFKQTAARWQAILDAAGITEDEAAADFKQWRLSRAE